MRFEAGKLLCFLFEGPVWMDQYFSVAIDPPIKLIICHWSIVDVDFMAYDE